MSFFGRLVVRLVGFLAAFILLLGGDGIVAAFVLFFCAVPAVLFILIFQIIEDNCQKDGTYKTSLACLILVVISAKIAALSIILWIFTGMLLSNKNVSTPNRVKV
jgi:Na+/proline symporter